MSIKLTLSSAVNIPSAFFNRIKTGDTSLDFLFGEGILPGSVTTLAAKHGTGKTQFCLQVLDLLASRYNVAYVSNEESIEQLAFTCKRIGVNNVPIGNVVTVKEVVELIKDQDVVVIDSFSKLKLDYDDDSKASTIERQALGMIIEAAKAYDTAVVLITHQTKGGQARGSSTLLHDVDATLYIERPEEEAKEDPNTPFRRIFFEKNRFGPSSEVVFEMTGRGYNFVQVELPSRVPKQSKGTKTQQRVEDILSSLTSRNGQAGIADIVNDTELPVHVVYTHLRELTINKQITKTGRGQQAVYKVKQQPQAKAAWGTLESRKELECRKNLEYVVDYIEHSSRIGYS